MKPHSILAGLIAALLFYGWAAAQPTATLEPDFITREATACSSCPPCRDESQQNWLTIRCAPSTDAAVRLIDKATGRCCRLAFVAAGDSLRLTGIPAGQYFCRIAYGRDWQFDDPGSCRGHFAAKAIYKESKRIFDFRPLERKKYVQYPGFVLSLSLTEETAPADAGKAVKDQPITADQFNR